jgi:hypothetical protein
MWYKVLYEFTAEEEGELSVSAGERVQDYAMGESTPEGWILVKSATDQVGFIPKDYAEEVNDVEEPEEAAPPIMQPRLDFSPIHSSSEYPRDTSNIDNESLTTTSRNYRPNEGDLASEMDFIDTDNLLDEQSVSSQNRRYLRSPSKELNSMSMPTNTQNDPYAQQNPFKKLSENINRSATPNSSWQKRMNRAMMINNLKARSQSPGLAMNKPVTTITTATNAANTTKVPSFSSALKSADFESFERLASSCCEHLLSTHSESHKRDLGELEALEEGLRVSMNVSRSYSFFRALF